MVAENSSVRKRPFATSESRLTSLALEARGLQLYSNRFAMEALAASTLPGDMPSALEVREVLRDLSASWSKLRNSESHFLKGADPALVEVMTLAFSRETERVFECFEGMARNICITLLRNGKPDLHDLSELVRFVSLELSAVNASILTAASLVAEMGARDTAKLALTDELTGLPNRRALHDLLHRMEAAGWSSEDVAIMQVDLDKFKQINDTLGHAAGDAALQHAAAAMKALIHKEDFLARVGGDEFAMVFFGPALEEKLAQRAKNLIAGISAPFLFDGKKCHIGGSVGIACGNRSDNLPLDRYLINADLALYTAKSDGRGTFRFFTPNLRTRHEEKEELQAQIRDGLELNQFEPYFQPQVEGRSGRLVGLESLARWNHPTRGLLSPFHFLDAADDAGLLEALDRALMLQTFSMMNSWMKKGLKIPQVSINLTANRLMEVNLVDSLLYAIEQADLTPSMVGVEILESAMIDNNSSQMIKNIGDLSDADFKVELDDFGTGHASISNLRNFRVDRIKIDRSFVKDVHLYSELSKITAAMIGLAHSLRVDALAEGVETPEERLVLNALGCDHIQGYGVSRPIAGTEVEDWVKRTQRTKRLPDRRGKSPAVQSAQSG